MDSKSRQYINDHNLQPVLSELLNTLVAEKTRQPEIFMIKYLSSLLSEEERIKNGIHVPGPYPSTKPIVLYQETSKLKKYLLPDIWNSIKYRKTTFGANINNVLNDSKYGLILTDSNVKYLI